MTWKNKIYRTDFSAVAFLEEFWRGWIFIPRNLLARLIHNFCALGSFFKRKKALESSRSQLSNAFFRLKNDLMEQKLWTILVNRFLGVKLFPHDSSKMQLRAKWYSGEKPYVLFVFSWNKTLKKKRQRITVSDTAKSEKPCPAYSKNATNNDPCGASRSINHAST